MKKRFVLATLCFVLTTITIFADDNIQSSDFEIYHSKYSDCTDPFKTIFNQLLQTDKGKTNLAIKACVITCSYFISTLPNGDEYGHLIDAVWVVNQADVTAVAFRNIIMEKKTDNRGIEMSFQKVTSVDNDRIIFDAIYKGKNVKLEYLLREDKVQPISE